MRLYSSLTRSHVGTGFQHPTLKALYTDEHQKWHYYTPCDADKHPAYYPILKSDSVSCIPSYISVQVCRSML